MATHSSILAWRISWTEEPGGLQSTGGRESDTTEVTKHACVCKYHGKFQATDTMSTGSQNS